MKYRTHVRTYMGNADGQGRGKDFNSNKPYMRFKRVKKVSKIFLAAFLSLCFVFSANIAKPLAESVPQAQKFFQTVAATSASFFSAGLSSAASQESNASISYDPTRKTLTVGAGTVSYHDLRNAINPHKTEMEAAVFLGDTTITNTSDIEWPDGIFQDCAALNRVDFAGATNFAGPRASLKYMFYNCPNLTYLDLSGFNSNNIVSTEALVGECPKLYWVNLSSFQTGAVEDMSFMFQDCTTLYSLDLSHFNTSHVESMQGMFWGCTNLRYQNLASFDTSALRDSLFLFRDCTPNYLALSSSFFNTSASIVMPSEDYFSYNYAEPTQAVSTSPTSIDSSAFGGGAPQTQIFIENAPYSLMFNATKGLFSDGSKLQSVGCAASEVSTKTVTPPATNPVSSDGANFAGWTNNPESQGTVGVWPPFISASGEYFAVWNYLVTFDFNFPGAPSPEVVADNEGQTIKNAPTPPSRDNIHFAGWCLDQEGTRPWYMDEDVVESNMTLYAKWEINTTFDGNGGTFGDESPASPSVTTQSTAGQPLSLPESDPVRPGFRFDYYTDAAGSPISAQTKTPETLPAGQTGYAYTAHWTQVWTIDFEVETNGDSTDHTGGTTNPNQAMVSDEDASCASHAQANEGYAFVGWWQGSTFLTYDEELSVEKPASGSWADATYSAHFVTNEATLTYSAYTAGSAGDTGGSVDPTSETLLVFAQEATGSVATPKEGYYFDGWYKGSVAAGNKVSSDSYFVPTRPTETGHAYWQDVTYIANFLLEQTYTLNFAPDSATAGSVSLTTQTVNASQTEAEEVTATANAGYDFDWWEVNDGTTTTIVSTDATFKPERPASGWTNGLTYTAVFEKVNPVLLTFTAAGGGFVSGSQSSTHYVKTFAHEVTNAIPSVTAYARAADGTSFLGWYAADGAKISSNAELELTKPAAGPWVEATYEARFTSLVTVYAIPEAGGSLDSAGTSSVTRMAADPYATETLAPVSALPAEHFAFLGWFLPGADTPLSTDTTWTPSRQNMGLGEKPWGNYIVYARFAPMEQFTLSYYVDTKGAASLGAGGDVDPNAEMVWEDSATALGSTATANAGYLFVGWYAGDTLVATTPHFVPTKPSAGWQDASYTARFVSQKATLSFSAVPSEGGSVSQQEATVDAFDEITIRVSATPNDHYKFEGWSLAGVQGMISTDPTLVLQRPAAGYWTNASYEAHFSPYEDFTLVYRAVNLSSQTEPGGSVTTGSERVFNDEEVAPLGSSAVPYAGYQFVGWSLNEEGTQVISVEEDFKPVRPGESWEGATNYYAIFAPDSWAVVRFAPEGNGTCEPLSRAIDPAAAPETIESIARPQEGNQLVGWYDAEGNLLQTDPTLTLKKPAAGWTDALYTARFEEIPDVTPDDGGSASDSDAEGSSLIPLTGDVLESAALLFALACLLCVVASLVQRRPR